MPAQAAEVVSKAAQSLAQGTIPRNDKLLRPTDIIFPFAWKCCFACFASFRLFQRKSFSSESFRPLHRQSAVQSAHALVYPMVSIEKYLSCNTIRPTRHGAAKRTTKTSLSRHGWERYKERKKSRITIYIHASALFLPSLVNSPQDQKYP